MARINYNGSTAANSSSEVCPQNASRTGFFFKSLGSTFVLNFGDEATSENVLRINPNESIYLSNSHKEPYDIRAYISVFSEDDAFFQASAEE